MKTQTLLQSPQYLRKWLDDKPDDILLVGLANDTLMCPVGNMLRSYDKIPYEIGRNRIIYVDSKGKHQPHWNAPWLEGFILQIDKLGTGHYITKPEAVAALNTSQSELLGGIL